MDDKRKELINLLKSVGRVNIDDVGEQLKLDKKTLYFLVDELKSDGLITLEPHFLKAPDLVATEKLGESKTPPPQPQKEEPEKEEPEKEEAEKEVKTDKPKEKREPAKKKPPEKEAPKKRRGDELEIESYSVLVGKTKIPVRILDIGDYVNHYEITTPKIDFVTRALLDETKKSLVGEIQIETHAIMDSGKYELLKTKFLNRARDKISLVLKRASEDYIDTLSRVLVNEMIGLGEIEYLLADKKLEEVVVNSSKEVVWVYHKQHGWIKTNIIIPTEDVTLNYSSRIAREVGREITHLEPLLDAHLSTGDRVNATLFPISTAGNTITIRRFSRTPWTMVHLMDPEINTISADAAAFLWLAMEYEFSTLVSGGTASGKTTMLNALMPFMPPNQRIITIEDTRELNLPKFLHWVPLTVRPPNPHGEGEISMLDLIQNALRMRPDRIIVGEVRRKRETEVLFEAMHTGHSVYGTFHAEQAYEVVDRITTPPMSIPPTVLSSLHLIVIQYRNRRTGTRKTFEITEILKGEGMPELNTLFRWNARDDVFETVNPSIRVRQELETFAGMSEAEMEEDLEGKRLILEWLLKNNIRSVNDVGRIVSQYCMDKDTVLSLVKKGNSPSIVEE